MDNDSSSCRCFNAQSKLNDKKKSDNTRKNENRDLARVYVGAANFNKRSYVNALIFLNLFLIIAYAFSDLFKLCPDSSCRYTHGYGLYGTDLIVREAILFGNAKEIFHSWVTTDAERCRQLDHYRCFLIKYFIFSCCFVKFFIFLFLLFG